MKIYSYKELIVWQKSISLVVLIYKVTAKFPKEEIYGLISQMRRAAIAIPSKFELETQLTIAYKLNFMEANSQIVN